MDSMKMRMSVVLLAIKRVICAVEIGKYALTRGPFVYNMDSLIISASIDGNMTCALKCTMKPECVSFLKINKVGTAPDDCYSSASHFKYAGRKASTYSGLPCQRWDEQHPHLHVVNTSLIPEDTLTDASNYCRDPDNSGGLWCYTMDAGIRWEFCDIPRCRPDNCFLLNEHASSIYDHPDRKYYEEQE